MRVFNPNADNAFCLDGAIDAESVEGAKLYNWVGAEMGLERARQTGGCVLQLLFPPGLSRRQ